MRLSPRHAAEAIAWVVFLALIGVALVVAHRLGFVGLFLLGAATWLVCVRAEMDQDVPTWGAETFRSRMEDAGSPEQRAAALGERQAAIVPLRFGRRCGIVVTTIGALGFLWQQWHSGTG